MGELIKSRMTSRAQFILNDTKKIDRMRFRERQKESENQTLILAKTTPMPCLKPDLRRHKDEKCRNCDEQGVKFTIFDDWYLEPINVLELKLEMKSSWEWMKALCVKKLIESSMDALVVHSAHLKMLKNVQQQKPDIPKIFVISSENPDFSILLVLYILWTNGINMPMVTVSESLLKIPFVGRILMDMGAGTEKFTKSEFLHSNGNFIVQLDKDLPDLLEACDGGREKEVLLLPISVSTEKIINDFQWKFSGNDNFGLVKVNFHEPYFATDFRKLTNQKIVEHLRFDLVMKRTVMATNVVAFLILTEFRNGTDVEILNERVIKFQKENSSIDFGFDITSEEIVNHALEILGEDLVSKDLKPTENIMKLSRYAEVVTPHFASQSCLLIAARYLKNEFDFIDYRSLLDEASSLVKILSYQNPLIKPCVDSLTQMTDVFSQCSLQGIMSKPESKTITKNEQRAMKMASYFESDTEESYDSSDDGGYQSRPDDQVTIHEDSSSLLNVVMPILDSNLTTAYMLKNLYVDKSLKISQLIKMSVKAMSEEIEDGRCFFWESCDPRYVESFINYLQDENVIEVQGNHITLENKYNSKKEIRYFIGSIGKFFVDSKKE